MKLIACVDKDGGMLFNSRRQSRDRYVIENILKQVSKNKLYIYPYSAALFPEQPNIVVTETFLSESSSEDYYFIEQIRPSLYRNEVTEVVLYNWNRTYPSDLSFDLNLDTWYLINQTEFAGYSHEKITKEVYRK